MYFDLLNTTNTLSSRLVSLEAFQLVQSKIRWSNLRFSPVVRVAVSTILKECMKCSLSLQIIHETRREGEPLFLAIISLKRSTHNNSQRIFIPSSLEKKTLHHVVNSN